MTTPQSLAGLVIVLLGLGGLVTSCGKAVDPQVVATVGTRQIWVDELTLLLRRREAHGRTVDAQRVLDELIQQELLYQKAVASGLERDPELQRAIRNLLIGKLRERELNPRIEELTVSPEEVRQNYEAHRAQHTRPARVRLAILQLKTQAGTTRERAERLKARMEEAREKALAQSAGAAGFGSLAIAYSEDQATRYKGGDIGWVEMDRASARWNVSVLQAGAALPHPGAISAVIEEADGVYLVRLIERSDATLIPIATVEAGIRQRLLAEKRAALEAAFLESTRTHTAVRTYPQALSAIPLQTASNRVAAEPPPLP